MSSANDSVEIIVYLIIGELEPWLFSISEDLPQNNAKAPHITFCGELSVHDALWWHPADRQHGVTSHLNIQIHTYTHAQVEMLYGKVISNMITSKTYTNKSDSTWQI